MSDRLKDLQRQRALVQEQIAWLDREIAREAGSSVAPSASAVASVVASPPRPPSAAGAVAIDGKAEELIERYGGREKSVHEQVRSGCFIYLGLAFGLVGLGLVALYIYHRMR